MASSDPFGVYVHVPFCTKRCDYCAFATWTDRFHLVDGYVEACATHARRGRDDWGEDVPQASSVFFGGGTPSHLTPSQVEVILASIPRTADSEVTMECNPDTVDRRKLAGYRQAGVNRLSFGVQSMVPHVLSSLGREHDPASVFRATQWAGEVGFADSYSVDLIFGAVGESLSDWEATLLAVLGLEPAPHHVSAYALTIERGTPLAARPASYPDADDQADKYLLADDIFAGHGLRWYEISNWARPDRECRHNQLYWDQGQYLGLGCAAHSHRVDRRTGMARRWWNTRSPERYMRAIDEQRRAEAGGEDLDASERRREALQLALRTRTGVAEAAIPGWKHDPVLSELLEPGEVAGRLSLTRRGRLLANEVALRLEPSVAR